MKGKVTIPRGLILLAAAIFAVVCAVLLLNFTAGNPTHRRYSSETVLTADRSTTENEIGVDGERIVGIDLDRPNNNNADQRLCICGTTTSYTPAECQVCITRVSSVGSYRIPDFVSDDYILEVKNRLSLSINDKKVANQIRDYATAAEALEIPFWLFVRTNTLVPPEMDRMVEATGGDVVYYLAVPGYTDPVDRAAQYGLYASGTVVTAVLLWELRARHYQRQGRAGKLVAPRTPLDNAQQLLDRAKSRADVVSTPADPHERPPDH